jgi:hypothetical protein
MSRPSSHVPSVSPVLCPQTPSAGGRCRVYLSPRGASDLLGVGTGIDSETGLLDVRWVEVAAGGESEFLPAAYRPLYRVL